MSEIDYAIAVFQRLRTTVQSYGDQHLAKTPPQIAKSEVNYSMVDDINKALLEMGKAKQREAVGSSNSVVPNPALVRLREYVETLAGRDDDSLTSYNVFIGDLRALTKDN